MAQGKSNIQLTGVNTDRGYCACGMKIALGDPEAIQLPNQLWQCGTCTLTIARKARQNQIFADATQATA